jgi:hypothetical protein
VTCRGVAQSTSSRMRCCLDEWRRHGVRHFLGRMRNGSDVSGCASKAFFAFGMTVRGAHLHALRLTQDRGGHPGWTRHGQFPIPRSARGQSRAADDRARLPERGRRRILTFVPESRRTAYQTISLSTASSLLSTHPNFASFFSTLSIV